MKVACCRPGPNLPEQIPARPDTGGGGEQVTVTDANLVLGRLLPDAFLGGEMQLDVAAAEQALGRLAEAMGCTMLEAAQGVIRIANEHMARALRTISVQRGLDPAGFTLMSFGGAGGLHVCALADALGMTRALVPVHGGVLSALGMLVARPGRRLSRTWLQPLDGLSDEAIETALDTLAEEALALMVEEGVAAVACELGRSLDLRYLGQSYTLEIPWSGRSLTAEVFHKRHAERYGHDLDLPLELVNLRLSVQGPGTVIDPACTPADRPAAPFRHCRIADESVRVGCYQRDELAPGQELSGPAIIAEQVATTWLARGCRPEWTRRATCC